MKVRRYLPADQAAVIALFREELGRIEEYYLLRPDQGFWVAAEQSDGAIAGMVGVERHDPDSTSELQLPAARLYESSGYRLLREETALQASHKTVGTGLTRYHYEKRLE